jgi:hypothetical protein
VLPAKPGTRLEPSNDEWFAALDASTRPIIMAPQPQNGGYGGYGGYGGDYYDGEYDYESSGGCCGSSTLSALSARDRGGAGGAENASAAPERPPPVEVVDQAVVGPYETITVRSTDPDALRDWLEAHGYEIPAISEPIITSYVLMGFDFIALRLSPSSAERAIQPIRIVSPGADLSLPLRLMQIGAGAKVGITLYVIGEGRYTTKSFPEAPVDFEALVWDYNQSRSNYQELLTKAMESNEGRSFVLEYADKPSFDLDDNGQRPGGMSGNPSLLYAYSTSCPTYGQPKKPVPPLGGTDGGTSGGDAGGGGDDGGGGDGGAADAGTKPRTVPAQCDDVDVAITGMTQADVWITRLRANLPNKALDATLTLEPSATQSKFDNVHQTTKQGTIAASIAPRRLRLRDGMFAGIGVSIVVLARILRRKRAA